MNAHPIDVSVRACGWERIEPQRAGYRAEMSCQIVHDSLHRRPGWVEWFEFTAGGRAAGYGAVVVGGPWVGTRTGFEFHVPPAERAAADALFDAFLATARVGHVLAQTNDLELTRQLRRTCAASEVEAIVYAAGSVAPRPAPGAVVRPITAAERESVFAHTAEPVGDWVVDAGGEVVATGGWLGHYNPPYVDLYLEVRPDRRRRGYGAHLVQELQRIARSEGKIPCARCGPDNTASQRTLARAGMVECARRVTGVVTPARG